MSDRSDIIAAFIRLSFPLFSSSIDADVVFVHGLRGGPFMTWRQQEEKDVKKSGTDCWPKVLADSFTREAVCVPERTKIAAGRCCKKMSINLFSKDCGDCISALT